MSRASLFVAFLLLLSLPPGHAALLAPEPRPEGSIRQADPAMDSYAAGVEALRRDDTDAAEAAFNTAHQANARMPQPLTGLADVALRRGRRDEAKRWLDQALEVAPEDDGVLHARSVFFFTGKDYPAAEDALKKALAINPKNLRVQLDLADLYANSLRQPSNALAAYRAAIAIDPKHAGAHHGLAQALASTGQFKAAEAEFRKSAALAPEAPVPLHSLARMQLSRGEADAGLATLEQALKVQPDFVPALLDKGDVLLGAGKPDAALALYDRAVAAQEKNATAHFKRGTVLQMQKRNVEAKQAYVTVISLDNAFAPAYNNLAWMQTETRDNLDQGSQWAATAVRLAPDNAAFRDTQGWVYRTQRRLAEAETVLEKAATMQPPIADIQYHLGIVYLDQKKPDLARQAFVKALAIDPKHAEATAALSKLGDTAKQ